MKYNASLDKILAAIVAQRSGRPMEAAKQFMAACEDSSLKAAVIALETHNAKAFAAKAKATPTKASAKPAVASTKIAAKSRLKADADEMLELEDDQELDDIQADLEEGADTDSWPFVASGDDSGGVHTDELGDEFRVEPTVNSQRTVQEADADEICFDDEGDIDMEAEATEDEMVEESDDESTMPVLEAKKRMQARLARAMYNLQAAAKKKKKAPAKKSSKK
jgi:hypothetical protein